MLVADNFCHADALARRDCYHRSGMAAPQALSRCHAGGVTWQTSRSDTSSAASRRSRSIACSQKRWSGWRQKSCRWRRFPFKDLPLYNYDYDANFPPVATAFKDAIAAVDAVLFVTPEYNRSIPGGLKNAIDWASRP